MNKGIEEVKEEITKEQVKSLLRMLDSSKVLNYLTAGKYACKLATVKDIDIISIPCRSGRRYFISSHVE